MFKTAANLEIAREKVSAHDGFFSFTVVRQSAFDIKLPDVYNTSELPKTKMPEFQLVRK